MSVRQREVPTPESEDEESFTSHPDLAIESHSPSPEPSDNGPSADSMPPKSIPSSSKGKQRAVRFKQESTANVVRFGPLDLEPGSRFDDLFSVIFENLCEIVRRRALAEPQDISRYGIEHLDLLFKTEMEANNFAMTWTVHRFEPYSTCEAIVVEDN
ncbi:hypothetical protein B0H13DRAFT_1921108 [Mycena leptocephala]|jgi:hypothetical protein|nr:hypothetical protein B0H13DRAFT_1921108 [Mycena leptocephala]